MFISVFGFTGCRNSSDGCKKDTDCREGRVCSKGECIDTGVKVLNGDKTKKPDKKSVKTPDKIPPSNHIVTPIQPPIKSDPLGPILKNLNLNLDLDAPGGKISFRMKGMKNGVPAIEMCQKGKCSEVDMSDPDSMVDIMTKLMGSGNPTDLMSQFLKNFNNLGPMIPGNRNPGFPRPVIPNVNPRNPVISPSNPLPGGPYRSVKDILKDKNRAAGREAILGGMKPVNISLPDRVDFKTTGGVKIETTVNASVRTHLRKLAKISGTVIIRIKIQRVSGTLIRGELTELDFNN
ncbi:hypothetical protein KKD49_08130 [Myxococcota bacterium]|nr:hypothetical protein [Myxococcota bacterium]